jgi:hypothetical protein
MSAEEQKKLEDIRRKLKDIFVTAEKAAPKEETIKPAEQQTVTSGLLDLRDLARDLLSKAPEQQPAKVDDDMLFLNGGLFGGDRSSGSLAPPDLTKPTAPAPKPPPPVRAPPPPAAMAAAAQVEEVDVDIDTEGRQAMTDAKYTPLLLPHGRAKGAAARKAAAEDVDPDIAAMSSSMSGKKIAAITVGLALLFGGVFYFAMRSGGEDAADQGTARVGSDGTQSPTATSDTPAGTPTPAATTESPSGAVVTPGTPGTKDPKDSSTAKPKGDTTSAPDKTSKPVSDKGDKGDKGDKTPKAPATATAAAPPAETAKPAATAAPAPAGEEFNQSAARSALSAAASRAAGCKGDGPAGSASVSVTFASSGRVTSAKVDGGPFAGTPTGGCIASAFRSASVPPFSGSPITVRKTVNIR